MKPLLAAAALLVTAVLFFVACSHSKRTDPETVDVSIAPTGIRWGEYQGVAIPLTDQGPRTYTPAIAAGFAPAPAGAAVAAIVHTVRMSLAPDDAWAQIAATELAPGPGKDAWATARVLFSLRGTAESATAPRVVGYRIYEYVPGVRSRVTVFTEYPDASLAATRTVVVWVGEDWRLQLPDPGSNAQQVESIRQIPDDAVRLEQTR
ncbi:hypothetical protein [Nocardia sp. NPDC052566]|uniref:hypothetical protein n=1 Tax=Nocardia sp. NPDC052566 TaxID=3364330 RepID=UPI0037C5B90F